MANAAHASSEIWHRSLEDLLNALETKSHAARPGPFVINLQTSTAPVDPRLKGAPPFDKLQVYRLVRRGSDGAPQFQLRLGIIESDLEADAILATVREHYPNATKHAADDADRAAIARVVSAPQNKSSPSPAPDTSDTVPMVRALTEGASASPKVEIKPSVEDARWNIDELLPDLASGHVRKPPKATSGSSEPQLQAARSSGATQARAAKTPVLGPTEPKPGAAETKMKSVPEAARNPPMLRRHVTPPPQASRLASAKQEPIELKPTCTPVPMSAAPGPQARSAPDATVPPRSVESAAPTDSTPKHRQAPLPPAASRGFSASPLEASAERSTADSGTLQSLVNKIGTLVHAVEAHQEAVAAMPNRAVSPLASRPAAPAAAAAPKPESMRPTKVKSASNITVEHRPAIDSTQTVRALTSLELADKSASGWFAIQLMDSQGQIDPEQVPALDIFVEYRLYSVAEAEQDRSSYMLRLGFFSSELAAQAVAGYLAPHFPTTSIKRVSIAEHDRFSQEIVTAKKDVGEAGSHAVIEFSAPPALPAVRPDATTIESPKSPAQDATSMWARLTRRRS